MTPALLHFAARCHLCMAHYAVAHYAVVNPGTFR